MIGQEQRGRLVRHLPHHLYLEADQPAKHPMIKTTEADLGLARQKHQHGLDGNGDQRPDQRGGDAANGADPATKGPRFHDIAPGIAGHEGFEAQRL